MNSISSLIKKFTKYEKQQFKKYIKSKTTTKHSKLIDYLDLLNKKITSQAICKTMYGVYPHSGYYALRKRINNLFILFYAQERGRDLNKQEDEVKVLYSAGLNLILNKHHHIGFDCLQKALKKAKENEFYGICIDILLDIIQVAHINSSLNLNDLIQEYENYNVLKNKQDKIAIAYAEIKEKLNFYVVNSLQTNTFAEIEIILKQYDINIDKDINFRILFQIGQITLAKSYISKGFIKELNEFEQQIEKKISVTNPKNLNESIYKIRLLYLLAISNFRSKRFKKSSEYLNIIHKNMISESLIVSKEMHFKIIVLKSLNQNYLGNNKKSYFLLNQLLSYSKLAKENKNWLDGYGAMTLILFHGKQYLRILKLYKLFNKPDSFYKNKNGLEWLLRKDLILILTQYELGNTEEAEKQIITFKNKYSELLNSNKRIHFFLICIEKVVSNPYQTTNIHFHKFVESKLDRKPRDVEDIFALSFFAWLKSKMFIKDTYYTTLELVSNLEN
jgi:hypothetical protein|tara:strand:+ start:1280 stop:2788 length:1509 start_codon:yes stop_codon:yes gene_type:complete